MATLDKSEIHQKKRIGWGNPFSKGFHCENFRSPNIQRKKKENFKSLVFNLQKEPYRILKD